jgi:hypothetical protein
MPKKIKQDRLCVSLGRQLHRLWCAQAKKSMIDLAKASNAHHNTIRTFFAGGRTTSSLALAGRIARALGYELKITLWPIKKEV